MVAATVWVSCGGTPERVGHNSFDVATEKQASNCKTPGWQETIGRERWWKEKIGNVVLPLINPQETEFAPGYKEGIFDSLRLGASRDEVERQLGSPLKRWQGSVSGCEFWSYSRPAIPGSNFYQRNLEFDSTGALVEKHRHFYVD
jgi:hypothetical protein